MKRLSILGLLLALVAAVPAEAQRRGENTLRFHAGIFEPEGDSAYWDDKAIDFSGEAADFEDTVVAFDYIRRITPRLSLMASFSGYEGDADQSYLDFIATDGSEIFHNTLFEVNTALLGLMIHLAPPRAPVAPYLGAGGGFFSWSLDESGEFIDFGVVPNEIIFDTFFDEGDTFGWFWLAGLDVRLGRSWSVFGEARFTRAEDDLEGDFAGFGELDLSGTQYTAGFAWSF